MVLCYREQKKPKNALTPPEGTGGSPISRANGGARSRVNSRNSDSNNNGSDFKRGLSNPILGILTAEAVDERNGPRNIFKKEWETDCWGHRISSANVSLPGVLEWV